MVVMAAIQNLTSGNDAAKAATATASVTLPGGQLSLISVHSRHGDTDPSQPTLTLSGATFTNIGSVNTDNSGSQKRVTLFRAAPAADVTGTIAIDFGGQTQTDIVWVVDTVTGLSVSGTNGAGAVVQTPVTNQDRTGTATTLAATLAAFGSSSNVTYGVCAVGNTGTFTPGTGLSKVGENASTANNITLVTEFQNAADTSVDYTFSAAGELGIIALELKGATTVAEVQATALSTDEALSRLGGYATTVSAQFVVARRLGKDVTGASVQEMLAGVQGVAPFTSKSEQELWYNGLKTALSLSGGYTDYTIQDMLNRAVGAGLTLAQVVGA